MIKKTKEEVVVKEKKVRAKKAPAVVVDEVQGIVDQTVSEAPVALPKYNGVQILEVLSPIENGFVHCKMDNGTTMHVPEEIF